MSLAAVRARNRSRPPARRLPRAVLAFGVIALLGFGLYVFSSSFLEVYRLGREASRLEDLKRNLQEQNAVLREEMKLLQTPPYIEKLAREQLGLVKPGEVAILIIQPKAAPQLSPPKLEKDRRSPLQRIWRSITRRF